MGWFGAVAAGKLAFCPSRLQRFEEPVSWRFTKMLDALNWLNVLVQVLAGFGLVTLLLALLKHNAERRAWRRFKARVGEWLEQLREVDSRHPRELNDNEWRVGCERLLTDVGYSPLAIDQLLETSVLVAKGVAADTFFM